MPTSIMHVQQHTLQLYVDISRQECKHGLYVHEHVHKHEYHGVS